MFDSEPSAVKVSDTKEQESASPKTAVDADAAPPFASTSAGTEANSSLSGWTPVDTMSPTDEPEIAISMPLGEAEILVDAVDDHQCPGKDKS